MADKGADKHRGRCLCGDVAFEVEVPRTQFHVCHCGMCRRWGGGPWMSVICPGGAVFTNEAGLAWYRSSKWAERGFCKHCGSSLFFRMASDPDGLIVVSVDALEDGNKATLGRHIYVDHQPSHYAFADDCPKLTEAEFLAEIGVAPVDPGN